MRSRKRRALAIVDLESAHSPRIGDLTVKSIHRHVAPHAPLEIVVPGGPVDALEKAGRIVVTGSALMLEDVPWADAVAGPVAQAAARGTPVLAICFGHQMMARHLGGSIASFNEIRKGVEPVHFEASGPFPAGPVPLIHTHRDHVIDPGELTACATGGFGGIAAARHPEWPMWTIQGHPEWDAHIARADDPFWKDVPDEELATPLGKQILERFGAL